MGGCIFGVTAIRRTLGSSVAGSGQVCRTDGYEHDRVRKDSWRYRDWVVRAINADMPYDEFVSKQLMGRRS